MKIRATLFTLAALLPLTGCVSTLAEIRESPPIRTATVAHASYRDLAACTMDGLEVKTGSWLYPFTYRLLDRPTQQSATVLANSGMSGYPMFEAAFSRQEAGAVTVETRKADVGLWGPLAYLEAARIEREDLWPIVERCAGTKVVVVPPLDG